jgi:hypothetical protein
MGMVASLPALVFLCFSATELGISFAPFSANCECECSVIRGENLIHLRKAFVGDLRTTHLFRRSGKRVLQRPISLLLVVRCCTRAMDNASTIRAGCNRGNRSGAHCHRGKPRTKFRDCCEWRERNLCCAGFSCVAVRRNYALGQRSHACRPKGLQGVSASGRNLRNPAISRKSRRSHRNCADRKVPDRSCGYQRSGFV